MVRSIDRPDMTIAVAWDINYQTKTNKQNNLCDKILQNELMKASVNKP